MRAKPVWLTVVHLIQPDESPERYTKGAARMCWSDAMTERAERDAEIAALREQLATAERERDELRSALDVVQQARIDAAVEGSDYKARCNTCRALLREIASKATRHKHNPNWLELTLNQDELDAIIVAATERAAGGDDGE